MMRLFSLYLVAAMIVAFVLGSPAWAALLSVKPDDCAAITAHLPDDDVAYQPGVDVEGNRVAPADLDDAGRIDYNIDDIVITIGHPLIAIDGVVGDQDRFVAGGGRIDVFGADLDVGYVTLQGGEVFFNGQRLTDNQRRAIAAACAEAQ